MLNDKCVIKLWGFHANVACSYPACSVCMSLRLVVVKVSGLVHDPNNMSYSINLTQVRPIHTAHSV